MSDVNKLISEVQSLRTEAAALIDLAADLVVRTDAMIERLPSSPANGLNLAPYTAREIVNAVVELGDRRVALVRTWSNAALEQRAGRRSRVPGGTPRVSNGASNGHGLAI